MQEAARAKHCEAQARYRANKRAILAEKERTRRASKSMVRTQINHLSFRDPLLYALQSRADVKDVTEA